MATGYEQARSVVAALAGDWTAARDVRLDLPETGVCDSGQPTDSDRIQAGGGCCGTPATTATGRGLTTGGSLSAPLTLLPVVGQSTTDTGSGGGCAC